METTTVEHSFKDETVSLMFLDPMLDCHDVDAASESCVHVQNLGAELVAHCADEVKPHKCPSIEEFRGAENLGAELVAPCTDEVKPHKCPSIGELSTEMTVASQNSATSRLPPTHTKSQESVETSAESAGQADPTETKPSPPQEAQGAPAAEGASPLHLFVGTLNAGNAQINNVDQWVPVKGRLPPELREKGRTQFDLVAIALQESAFSSEPGLGESPAATERTRCSSMDEDSDDEDEEAQGESSPDNSPAQKLRLPANMPCSPKGVHRRAFIGGLQHFHLAEPASQETDKCSAASTPVAGQMKRRNSGARQLLQTPDSREASAEEGHVPLPSPSKRGWFPRGTTFSFIDTSEVLVLFSEHLGPDYKVLEHEACGQMILMVFVHRSLDGLVSNIEASHERTGVAKIGWNKGGQLVKFAIGHTPICFFSAHLAAHQAQTARRNADFRKIMAGCRAMDRNLDAALQAHHTFVLGDLNYRIEPPAEEKEGSEMSTSTSSSRKARGMTKQLQAAIANGDWHVLLASDQLSKEIAEGHVLAGFEAPAPNFAPTFKVQRGKVQPTYQPERVPSYTDRILHRSLPGFRPSLELLAFESCPMVTSSDHKPVRAMYRITPSKPPERNRGSPLVVELSQLSVQTGGAKAVSSSRFGLPRRSVGQEEHRFLKFSTLPGELCWSGPESRRAAIHLDQCTWPGVLTLELKAAKADEVHLIVECCAPEGSGKCHLVGAAPISLRGIHDGPLRVERIPLERNGQVLGYFTGQVRVRSSKWSSITS